MPSNYTQFHQKLHRWYATHGRHELPWRKTTSPYEIYLSETMLQQTQVATVLDRFYFQFLKKFPTLLALSQSSEKEVLSAWQGLGYYTRARNLHKVAIHSKGSLPDDVEALIALPGIGRNTAHAVAAFAFKKPVPVMEANVKRVLCRIFALKNPKDNELWELAAALMDKKHPFDYNQAMMDIGAIVCKKRAPLCEECPANTICDGKTNPEHYPAPKVKKAVPVRKKNIIVLQNAVGKFFATPRETKFLGGLYHFIETEEKPPAKSTLIGGVTQQYSHFTLDAMVYIASSKETGKEWFSLAQLQKLPVSMAEKKIFLLLKNHNESL